MIAIITAYNNEMKEVGDLCWKSMQRYVKRHDGVRCHKAIIPDDYERPASWFKPQMIARFLPYCEFVLWIDSDALIIGDMNFNALVKKTTLNISRDLNGVNCGVMAWRQCVQSFRALTRIDMGTQHTDHPWWDQAALMEFVDEIDVTYQPKEIWNAYESDRTAESMVLHFPGMDNVQRFHKMEHELDKLCNS